MPYELIIQEQEKYLRVNVSGARTPGNEVEDGISVWSRVAEACTAQQKDLVLAIYSITGSLPARAAHAIAYDPERFGWSKRFKAAIVDLNEESRQDMLFVEDVAVSSGYRIRVFDNEQKAEEWLLGN